MSQDRMTGCTVCIQGLSREGGGALCNKVVRSRKQFRHSKNNRSRDITLDKTVKFIRQAIGKLVFLT